MLSDQAPNDSAVVRLGIELADVTKHVPKTDEGAAIAVHAAIGLIGYLLIDRGIVVGRPIGPLCSQIEELILSYSEARQC